MRNDINFNYVKKLFVDQFVDKANIQDGELNKNLSKGMVFNVSTTGTYNSVDEGSYEVEEDVKISYLRVDNVNVVSLLYEIRHTDRGIIISGEAGVEYSVMPVERVVLRDSFDDYDYEDFDALDQGDEGSAQIRFVFNETGYYEERNMVHTTYDSQFDVICD